LGEKCGVVGGTLIHATCENVPNQTNNTTYSVLYKVNFDPKTRYANMAFGSEKAIEALYCSAARNVSGPQLLVPVTLLRQS
jgi:hypothetical protein